MTAPPASKDSPSPAAPVAARGWRLLARRRVRPVVAAAVVLVCLLATGIAGYAIIYPQVNAVYHWRHAQRAIDDYDFAQAQAHLRRCLEVWPDSGETHFLMARTCRRAGDMDGARAYLRQAKRLHWVDDEIRLEYLLMQAQFGAVPQVERVLRDYLRRGHAEETLILEALVAGCWQTNLTMEAYRWATIWTERHPDDWHARLWNGRILESGSQDTQAEEEYRKVLAQKPDQPLAQLLLGQVLVRKGNYAEALPHFEASLRGDPQDPTALLGLARCQRCVSPPEVVQATLDQLIAGHPDDVPALLLRGQLDLAEAKPEPALVWLRRAYALAPKDALTNKSLATALRLLKKDAEAKEYDRRSQELDKDSRRVQEIMKELLSDPKDVALRCEAGTILLRLRRAPEAIRWLISALLLDPSYEPAKKSLAECLHQLGDPKLEESYRAALAGRQQANLENQP